VDRRYALLWFGHRGDCDARSTVPRYRGYDALVCTACMLDFVPSCTMCTTAARSLGDHDGYRHYTFAGMCPECVHRVRSAGPWKQRRAAALAARVDALAEAFAGLVIERATTGKRVVMSGAVGDRHVRFTLKLAAREYEDERYVLRAELLVARELGAVDRSALLLDPALLERLSEGSPKIVRDDRLWLRIAFLHLGKIDAIVAARGLLASAEALDRA